MAIPSCRAAEGRDHKNSSKIQAAPMDEHRASSPVYTTPRFHAWRWEVEQTWSWPAGAYAAYFGYNGAA